jgi:type VII secretion protein EccB
MATVRDQVEAYNFATRRQVLALLKGDDAATVDPRRRLNRALLGGMLLAVVVAAAVGVAGFLSSGSSGSVPADGVIVDADTGGAYVRIGNVLHPALNLASAKLVAGHSVTRVSDSALRSLPRGLPVGIPGAPDSLPPTGDLTARAWSVCSIAPEATAARARIVVSVGSPVPSPLPRSSGLVVQTPDGATWLLDGGQRYQVSDVRTAAVLSLNEVAPLAIDPAVLDLIPEGPPLDVRQIRIPGTGGPPQVQLPFAARVGDVLSVDTGTNQPAQYVVLTDGVAPVDPFAYRMLVAAGGQPHQDVPADEIVDVAARTRPQIPAQWPHDVFAHPTAPPAAGEPLCVTYDPHAPHGTAAWPVTLSEPPSVPLAAHAAPVAASGGGLPTAATAVAVPYGGGALVKAVGSGGVSAVYTLVTDSGLRFTIANADAVGRLGYDPKAAVPVPLPFVTLLPAGPGLDPYAAAAEYAGGPAAPAATASPGPSGTPS